MKGLRFSANAVIITEGLMFSQAVPKDSLTIDSPPLPAAPGGAVLLQEAIMTYAD